MMTPENKRAHESGNAFFIVMVSVVLFAALMFTFSRGARQGGENMSEKQAEIAATDIISYAQAAERAVNRAYGKGISENDISFENPIISGYANGNCPTAGTKCRIFSSKGGGLRYTSADSYASTSAWVFSGQNTILDVGNSSNPDLVLLLPDINVRVCTAINDALNISPTPTDGNGIETSTKFQGSFSNSEQISDAAVSGVLSACVQDTTPNPDEYVFYHVLLAR